MSGCHSEFLFVDFTWNDPCGKRRKMTQDMKNRKLRTTAKLTIWKCEQHGDNWCITDLQSVISHKRASIRTCSVMEIPPYKQLWKTSDMEMNAYPIKWSALYMSKKMLVVGCGN
jgi:hypothetical protein